VKESTEVVFQLGFRQCPGCGSAQVRRSQRRGLGEYLLAAFLLRPYRCLECHARHMSFAFRRFEQGGNEPVNHSAA